MKKVIGMLLLAAHLACPVLAQDSVPSVEKLLDLSLDQLMNVQVVTASGEMQTTTEAPATITVITSQQIAERGYEQLEDALRDVPGIDMIHINGYAPTLVYFRGMYGAENLRALFMIDGIVENNILGSNDMAGPAYNLHNVERIEIIWGPVSALYGSDAFGGVINIVTKKGRNLNGLDAQQGFGSFNTRLSTLDLGIRKSNLEFNISGTLYNTDGPKFSNRDPSYTGSYVHNGIGLNGQLSYYAGRSTYTLGYRMFRTPMGWGTYSNSPTQYLGLPSQGYDNAGVLGVLQRDFRGARPGLDDPYLKTLFFTDEYKSGNRLSLKGQLVYRQTGIGDDSYIQITTDGRKMLYLPITSSSSRFAPSLTVNYKFSGTQRLSAGVEYTRDNVEAGARGVTIDPNTVYLVDGRDTLLNLNAHFLPRKYDIRTNIGTYLQYILDTKLLRHTSFTLGGRFDHNSYFGDAVSPRLAIVNQPTSRLTFKMMYGEAFRAPTNLEIYQTPPDSNFRLHQEQLETYELNAIYSPGPKLRLQLNVFENHLTHVIVLSNLSSPLVPNKNPALMHVMGVEAVFNMQVADFLQAFANFTYLDANSKNLVSHFSGQTVGIARFKANGGLTFHVSDLFMTSLTGNWVGQRRSPRTDPYGPVPAYFLTNLSVRTARLFGDRITAAFEIRNLFNVKWLDPGFRTADGFLYATVLEQPGVNGLFKIGINLK